MDVLPRARTTSSDSERSCETEPQRRIYEPTFAKAFDRRETPVRPVSARTYQQLLSPGEELRLQQNGLYGDESELRLSTASSSTFAERRKSARLRGEYQPALTQSPSLFAQPAAAEEHPRADDHATQLELDPEIRPAESTSDAPPAAARASEDTSIESLEPAPVRLAVLPSSSLDERAAFLCAPGSRQTPFACFIIRDRSLSKTYPRYYLYAEDQGTFLLSARRRKKSTSSNYLISLAENDLSRGSPHYFGKVRSNFIGTQFVIYDHGEKPQNAEKDPSMQIRSELGAVLYEHNILGTRGPRKMTAVLPKTPTVATSALTHAIKSLESEGFMYLVNKAPKWNDQLNAYCLNFRGRVTEASVKNFQLVRRDDPENVVLQFGKVASPSPLSGS